MNGIREYLNGVALPALGLFLHFSRRVALCCWIPPALRALSFLNSGICTFRFEVAERFAK